MVNPFILLPLYWYPSAGGSAWQSVFSQVAANPSTTFSIIINPNSGPGSTIPDAAFTSAVSKLHSYNNTQVLGYVHTSWAARSLSAVVADIDSYAAWATVKTADVHVDGIFFDEAPHDDKGVAYMTDVATHAKSALKLGTNTAAAAVNAQDTSSSSSSSSSSSASSSPFVMLNPGTPVSAAYYSLADNIVAAEIPYSSFSATSLSSIPAAHREKSSVILYGFSAGADKQSEVAKQIMSAGVPGVSITNVDGYMSATGMLEELVGAVGGAVGGVGGGGELPPVGGVSSVTASATRVVTATATATGFATVTTPADTTAPIETAPPAVTTTADGEEPAATTEPESAPATEIAAPTTTATPTACIRSRRGRPCYTGLPWSERKGGYRHSVAGSA